MTRLLLTIEATFRVKEGGLALIPPLMIQDGEGFRVDDPIILKRPDGSTIKWQIGGLTPIPPKRSPREIGLVLKGLKKQDIPVGTEVWSEDTQRQEPLPQEVPLPQRVIVRANDPCAEGLAVNLRFEMSMKNDHLYTVFLGPGGLAEISGQELLRAFDEECAFFIMDFDNPRSSFTGQISAQVLSKEELLSALKAYDMFCAHYPFPKGYEKNLKAAARKRGSEEYHVELEVES